MKVEQAIKWLKTKEKDEPILLICYSIDSLQYEIAECRNPCIGIQDQYRIIEELIEDDEIIMRELECNCLIESKARDKIRQIFESKIIYDNRKAVKRPTK